MTPDGEESILHKSVMNYIVTDDGVIYSNGKYIVSDKNAVKAHLAEKICGM